MMTKIQTIEGGYKDISSFEGTTLKNKNIQVLSPKNEIHAAIDTHKWTNLSEKKSLFIKQNEAKSLDQIKMTENWLEYERKIFTMMNLIFLI